MGASVVVPTHDAGPRGTGPYGAGGRVGQGQESDRVAGRGRARVPVVRAHQHHPCFRTAAGCCVRLPWLACTVAYWCASVVRCVAAFLRYGPWSGAGPSKWTRLSTSYDDAICQHALLLLYSDCTIFTPDSTACLLLFFTLPIV